MKSGANCRCKSTAKIKSFDFGLFWQVNQPVKTSAKMKKTLFLPPGCHESIDINSLLSLFSLSFSLIPLSLSPLCLCQKGSPILATPNRPSPTFFSRNFDTLLSTLYLYLLLSNLGQFIILIRIVICTDCERQQKHGRVPSLSASNWSSWRFWCFWSWWRSTQARPSLCR